jgi:predicted nucleic acid-binding Zn ribbon protein
MRKPRLPRRTAPPTPSAPTSLRSALEAYLKSAGLSRRLQQASVLEEWSELVGPQIAKVTRPDAVTADGVLRVRVATAPWASELSLMTPTILARINAGRSGRIKTIRWMPGGLGRLGTDLP